ncbi:unnamed protein product [Darwinula stevensoni]|uniref:Carboxylesterase type B domain-containing protein n=1 Tax=Darwinula stevensoni TaxID=69355 RepID=A0A7R9A7G2_9CRUS|nr:unnamed protein product [Darwinula stevensoni]CAG0893234.1 unnamed protein product [Darwinula stevensoni]
MSVAPTLERGCKARPGWRRGEEHSAEDRRAAEDGPTKSRSHVRSFFLVSEALFQRLVLLSGTAFGPNSVAADDEAEDLESLFGCEEPNCPFASLHFRDLLDRKPKWKDRRPIVDRAIVSDDNVTFVPEIKFRGEIPYETLVGVLESEGTYLVPETFLEEGCTEEERTTRFDSLLESRYDAHLVEVREIVNYEYTEWGSGQRRDPRKCLESLIASYSDALFGAPAVSLADTMSSLNATVFLFVHNLVLSTSSKRSERRRRNEDRREKSGVAFLRPSLQEAPGTSSPFVRPRFGRRVESEDHVLAVSDRDVVRSGSKGETTPPAVRVEGSILSSKFDTRDRETHDSNARVLEVGRTSSVAVASVEGGMDAADATVRETRKRGAVRPIS